MKKVLLSVVLLSCFFTAAQATEFEYGMGFGFRTLFIDTAKWNALVPTLPFGSLPQLSGPVYMHGGVFYGQLFDWLKVGLSGWGTAPELTNSYGMTGFNGAMVGFFGQAQYRIIENLYVSGGLTLSCGRFYFTSITGLGVGIRAVSGAIFFEPEASIGYRILDTFDLRISASCIFSLDPDLLWMGTGTKTRVDPWGPVVSMTLTFPIAGIILN